MIDERGASEEADRRDLSEEDPLPPAPRGAEGESRVVAERSGADSSFPERPLLADLDEEHRSKEANDGGGGDGDETPGKRVPEPEAGPTS
jgi:hypothetical protein